MASTIKVDTKGLDRLILNMEKLNGTCVEVGFFEEDRYGPENDNLPVALVAFYNEYGHRAGKFGPVPSRPFMHETFGGKQEQGLIAKEMAKVVEAAIIGRGVPQLLRQLGMKIAQMLESAIDDYPGSNSATTIRRKGFNDPLRDSGKMLESVKFEIHMGGKK